MLLSEVVTFPDDHRPVFAVSCFATTHMILSRFGCQKLITLCDPDIPISLLDISNTLQVLSRLDVHEPNQYPARPRLTYLTSGFEPISHVLLALGFHKPNHYPVRPRLPISLPCLNQTSHVLLALVVSIQSNPARPRHSIIFIHPSNQLRNDHF